MVQKSSKAKMPGIRVRFPCYFCDRPMQVGVFGFVCIRNWTGTCAHCESRNRLPFHVDALLQAAGLLLAAPTVGALGISSNAISVSLLVPIWLMYNAVLRALYSIHGKPLRA